LRSTSVIVVIVAASFSGFEKAWNKDMKLVQRKSGQLYTVEAILAIVIMVGFSIFISGVYRVHSSRVASSAELRQMGEDALGALDGTGRLASWVCVGPPNVSGLDGALSQLLPSRVAYNVYVLDVDLNQVGNAYVIHGDPTNVNVVVVLYVVSGYGGYYGPRAVKLELWYVGD